MRSGLRGGRCGRLALFESFGSEWGKNSLMRRRWRQLAEVLRFAQADKG